MDARTFVRNHDGSKTGYTKDVGLGRSPHTGVSMRLPHANTHPESAVGWQRARLDGDRLGGCPRRPSLNRLGKPPGSDSNLDSNGGGRRRAPAGGDWALYLPFLAIFLAAFLSFFSFGVSLVLFVFSVRFLS